MCRDTLNEVGYERNVELSVSTDYVVKDLLELEVSRIHGNGKSGGWGEDCPSGLCTRVWRSVAAHAVFVHIRETPKSQSVLPIFESTDLLQLGGQPQTSLAVAAT